jgi:glycosyltransferase involved in cell wall biosynthesis
MKTIVLTADANTLVYHRGDLIREMAARGTQVVTSAAEDYPHARAFVESVGGRHRAIRMARSTVSLTRDWQTWGDIWKLFREEKPDALFAYTIKSVCYGCVIARLAGVKRIYALLPGLGLTFNNQHSLKGKVLSWVSRQLHRFALKQANVIFVQNADDEQLLRRQRILPRHVPVHVTAGSGVNLEEYAFDDPAQHLTDPHSPVRFVLVSRLLRSKGVELFAQAARAVRKDFPNAEFHLVGPFDPSPDRITEEEVRGWVEEGTLTHHGMVRDVASLLKKMDVFVLPTWYREGVPHATLEALSVGRAVITTDSVGARETVRLTEQGQKQRRSGFGVMEGENGFLIRPRDLDALCDAMRHVMLDRSALVPMGRASRRLAEDVFDVRKVNAIILRAMGLAQSPEPAAESLYTASTQTVSA